LGAAGGAAPPRPSRAPRAACSVRARRASAPERERRGRPRRRTPLRPRPPSVQLLADRRQRRARVRIPRLDRERVLELVRRLREQPLRPVDLPQIAVRVVARLVAWRLDRRLEPGDRLLETPELDQVRADVVVGIPEVGIDRDRLLALRDRVLEPPLEAVGPAEEGVRLGGGVERDRLLVALDGGVQLALHLQAVGLLEQLDRLLEALLLGHPPGDDSRTAPAGQRPRGVYGPRRRPRASAAPPGCSPASGRKPSSRRRWPRSRAADSRPPTTR